MLAGTARQSSFYVAFVLRYLFALDIHMEQLLAVTPGQVCLSFPRFYFV